MHGGENIPLLRWFGRIDVTRNVEVVAVCHNFGFRHNAGEFRQFPAMGHAIDNALDVACLQMVVFAHFDEMLGGVNHQYVVTFALLA